MKIFLLVTTILSYNILDAMSTEDCGDKAEIIMRAIDCYKKNPDKTNLFHLFITCHNSPYILFRETLVDIIPELGYACTSYYNPLVRAVFAQDYEFCEFLLKSGISPSFKAYGQISAFEANKIESNENDSDFLFYNLASKEEIYALLKKYDNCSEPLAWLNDINQYQDQGEYRLF